MKFPPQSDKFSEENYSELVDNLNNLASAINFQDNFNGQILRNLSISAGETKRFSHNLKRVPLYRVILRQTGNALISDGPSWDGQSIQLKNNSDKSDGETVILTIMLT